MKVLHVTTIDIGGAYKAAVRLHEGLTRIGVQSEILLRTKSKESNIGVEVFSNRFSAIISKVKNGWNLLQADGEITRDVLGTDISRNSKVLEADIIILHWINSFLTVREFEKLAVLQKPILWILHDMWLFTGGCHYDGYCGRYESGCGNCPYVSKRSDKDISWRNFMDKEVTMNNIRAVIVGPGQWIVECARRSNILSGKKIVCLPNMLDVETFCPIEDKVYLRRKYGITADKKVILFGAACEGTENKRKGFSFLMSALRKLPRDSYQLAVFGNASSDMKLPEGFGVTLLGVISDERELTEIYNLADVLVNPSIQESFGYTACEAMACGTPVVAFPVGGLREQITHLGNGYLAEFQNAQDIAKGIIYCAENREQLGVQARKSAVRYSYEHVAVKYLEFMKTEMGENV
ncbi:MAG: glycosyltransferase [Lachnospiraceae bacterium]|nr:glycosyltransferase [Lachnospiraceae bacterium]